MKNVVQINLEICKKCKYIDHVELNHIMPHFHEALRKETPTLVLAVVDCKLAQEYGRNVIWLNNDTEGNYFGALPYDCIFKLEHTITKTYEYIS